MDPVSILNTLPGRVAESYKYLAAHNSLIFRISNPWVDANLNEKGHYDVCHVYKNVFENATNFMEYNNGEWRVKDDLTDLGNETVTCDSFVFKSRYHSLVARFSLVCSRTLMLALSQSFHILGLLIGGIIAYYLVRV